ncbi:MAG: ester cyclase [Saccharospirillaceae bacterium]|nr:ester cyclase [Pseudomonadales bacterium]NRB78729.1 ester cyclase [Saccharospirillaceae bacterium]
MNKSILGTSILAFLAVSACNDTDSNAEDNVEEQCITTQCIEDDNQTSIERIYSEVINNKNHDLVDSIYTVDFIHNNSAIGATTTGQKSYFDALVTDNPDHVANIKHIVADGEYVAVHWHYSDTPDNEFSGSINVDLFKLDNGLVVEQWDRSSDLQATTTSGNSTFSDLYVYANTAAVMDDTKKEENKTMVTDFYLDLFNTGDLTLVDEFVDINYLQHNIWVPNGSAALSNYVGSITPGGLEIALTLAEDDMVWTFVIGLDNLNLVDLWRVNYNDTKIVEHWDL